MCIIFTDYFICVRFLVNSETLSYSLVSVIKVVYKYFEKHRQ